MNRLQALRPLHRDTLCRLTFTGILLSLIYAWKSHVLLHQMGRPPLRFAYLDPVFWLAHLLAIPEALTSSRPVALVADGILFLTTVLTLIFPGRRLFPLIFFCVYFIYFICFNSFGAHHTLSKTAVLLLPIPFAFRQKRFVLLWEAMRYYLLLIFASAFCWKLLRLAWFNPLQGEIILRNNLAAYLYLNPDTTLANMYRWLLHSPVILQISFLSGFLLEGAFIAGFLTKKYDRILLLIFPLLVGGFWFFADALFAELLLFGLTLFPALDMKREPLNDACPTGS